MLFGGASSSSDLDDTWTWNGSVWSEASFDGSCSGTCPGPAARIGPTMAFDPATGQMILEGGENAGWPTDTWDFDDAPLVLAPATLSWSTTLSGYDASVSSAAVIEVANETAQGWDLAVVSSSQPSQGSLTLPSPTVNASALSASSSSAPSASCLLTTCVAPTGNSVTYPVTVPVSSAADLYSASAGTGVGDFDLPLDVWQSVPAKSSASTYTATITVTLDFGP